MFNVLKTMCIAAILLLLTGCEHYAQRPLQADNILRKVEQQRHQPNVAILDDGSVSNLATATSTSEFTFARAVELMKQHSPALRDARAEYDTAQTLACIKTPLPNPSFEAGPMYGSGKDVGPLYRVQPFGSLSFAIPTGQRLKRQDELNQVLAAQSYFEIQAKHRELYMDLRREYVALALSRQRIDRRKAIAESAEKSTSITKRMIEIGQMTALDAGLIEVEQARLKIEVFSAQALEVTARGELSNTVGVHSEHFEKLPAEPLSKLPEQLPALAELQKLMLNNNPALARLRTRYEVAERELHLEISKQYPDFKFGPTFDREVGERKTTIGLTLGIDLPIFDRNQQAIATAKQRREEIRTKYETAANRALATLDRAYANSQLAAQKLKLLNTLLLPRVNSNIDLSRKSMEAGVSDLLKFLEAERNQRATLLETLETELALRLAWIELEQAVGYPLAPLPTEITAELPALDGVAPSCAKCCSNCVSEQK